MANEEPRQPGGEQTGEGEAAQILALSRRVAELERAMAALERRVGAQPGVPASLAAPPKAAAATAEERAAVPSPPPPMPASRPEGMPAASAAAWPPEPPAGQSFENRLGSQIFNRIGIVLLLIGVAYFLKLAIDRHWIVPSPAGRTLIGLTAGACIVVWSESFRRKGFAAFSYSLKALGSGVLYLTLWAAFQLYHLLPASVALALMLLVTAWNAFMAWAQDSELLAAYALAGGFATPLLLSTGGNHETFLFTYLLAIDIAAVVLVRVRVWPRLLIGAFPLTAVFFIGWYAQHYAADALTPTTIFIAAFGLTFASVSVRRTPLDLDGPAARLIPRVTLIEEILLPLANSGFVALALYSVLQDSGYHALLPWLMVVLAALYLGLMRMPQGRTASAIHLSIAVVLLTIAVPLKASGHWITVSWLVEGLALLWVATRLAAPAGAATAAESYASDTLRWLASAALALGFFGIFVNAMVSGVFGRESSVFSANTATALVGIAIFAGAAALALRSSATLSAPGRWLGVATTAFLAIDCVALLLTLRELFGDAGYSPAHRPFETADFFTALIGLAVFAGVVAVSLRFAKAHAEAAFWQTCAAGSTIAFNLIAVLTGVREIAAIWPSSGAMADLEAALQQALAISAFLMLYGAAVLAAGFWRRSAFLRWQALLLLIFTILKTFLYDMRNLSQGYRVASAMGLGALLMAISFAYQKDWLNLRDGQSKTPPSSDPEASR